MLQNGALRKIRPAGNDRVQRFLPLRDSGELGRGRLDAARNVTPGDNPTGPTVAKFDRLDAEEYGERIGLTECSLSSGHDASSRLANRLAV